MTIDVQNSSDGRISDPLPIEGEDHLATIVEQHDVVLVDFFATWCGPCKMMEPVLAQLAQETDAVVAKVDVDQHQTLAASFGVRGVPTLTLFAEGEQVEEYVGAYPADHLRSEIDKYV